MANELPYFRFTVQAWQNGRISLESYELKGLFIDICGFYWIQDCSITLAMLKKKYSNATAGINELVELGIIKHENRHDKVEIEFLNIQYDLLSEKRKARQEAGSKGGNAKAMLKQKGSYKDKDNNKDKDKDKDNLLSMTLIESVINDLNAILNTKYSEKSKKTISLINARISEGFNQQDFKKVVECKFKQWGNDPKMKEYLRPETLFGNKFESYLQSAKNNVDKKEYKLYNSLGPQKFTLSDSELNEKLTKGWQLSA